MNINFDNYVTARISRRYSGTTENGSKFTVYAEYVDNEGWSVSECDIFFDDKTQATPKNESTICDLLLEHLES